MKTIAIVTMYLLLTACGVESTHTEIRDICSADSPALVLPDEIVCNHAPKKYIEVIGHRLRYLCIRQEGL